MLLRGTHAPQHLRFGVTESRMRGRTQPKYKHSIIQKADRIQPARLPLSLRVFRRYSLIPRYRPENQPEVSILISHDLQMEE